jgi:2-polyprenyl-3-methyl-5-hydroxy-6-metoxy-1,4-benzoquinol methylase
VTVGVAFKIEYRWRRLQRRLTRRSQRALRWAARRRPSLPSLWLRLDNEAASCPACGGADLAALDVFRVRGDLSGSRIAFLTGCETCGLLFSNPLPRADRLERYYDETGVWGEAHADRAARLAGAHERRAARQSPAEKTKSRKRLALFDAMQPYLPVYAPPPGARALDFGCGDGKLLNSLQEFGWETYGVEPSMSVAFRSHHRLDAPPAQGDFDLAILHHVLEHVANPLEILRQLAASLREGGTLFLSVPRFDTVGVHRDFSYCINGRNHIVCFTEACLRHLLALAGFDVTARLDAPELDALLTKGQPLRLRLIARRTATPPLLTGDAPLASLPVAKRMSAALPSRLRAGWLQWSLSR